MIKGSLAIVKSNLNHGGLRLTPTEKWDISGSVNRYRD